MGERIAEHVPCEWDFTQIENSADWGLLQAQVATWGGFVFINPDLGAASLQSHLGDLTEQFASWPLEDRFTQVHVAKVIRCNWKVAQEAFMEAMHVVTHTTFAAPASVMQQQYDASELQQGMRTMARRARTCAGTDRAADP